MNNNKVLPELAELKQFLPCATPELWIAKALAEPEILLIDHANCEKKAAATALNLMFRYSTELELLNKMSRLAREELRHFEQVLALLISRKIEYRPLSAGRYAGLLRQGVRTFEPARLIDTLIVGAFIEARSCERFGALSPHLDDELQRFYRSLLKSESRHFQDYLGLARSISTSTESISTESIDERVAYFADLEHEAICSVDSEFRFHSGIPRE